MTPLHEQFEKLRHAWVGFSVVDDSFESADISLNADRIADWWIEKLRTAETEIRADERAKVVEFVKKDSQMRSVAAAGEYEEGFNYGYDIKKEETLSFLANQEK